MKRECREIRQQFPLLYAPLVYKDWKKIFDKMSLCEDSLFHAGRHQKWS
jgi:hypothetical protein